MNKLILALCLLSFFACGKIKDATTVKIPVEKVTIELNDILVQANETRDGELNFFSATQTVTLADIQGLTEKALEYKEMVESIEVGETSSIVITTTDEIGTVVKEFILTTNPNVGTINIPQYNLGDVFTDNVQGFSGGVLLKLLQNGSMTFDAKGKTDIQSGENLKIKITLENINITAGLLN